ncbi:MAG: hypothetical protein AAF797_07895 [Planctomycetota bacterium]
MAWTSMHFAVGMACGATLSVAPCLLRPRLFRHLPRVLPLAMTAGGLAACIPDATRLFTEDFPNAPFAATLGSPALRDWLQQHADWFFFHGHLDRQPREFALHGLALIVLLYNLALLPNLFRRPRKPASPSRQESS